MSIRVICKPEASGRALELYLFRYFTPFMWHFNPNSIIMHCSLTSNFNLSISSTLSLYFSSFKRDRGLKILLWPVVKIDTVPL